MASFEIYDKENKIAFVSFEHYKRLELVDVSYQGFIRYGANNDYPEYILSLFESQSEHGAIVKTKAAYLSGLGLKAKDPAKQQAAEQFLGYANNRETWAEVNDMCDLDDEIFGGYYLKVETDLVGRPLNFRHMQFANCRLSRCGTILYYCEDWKQQYRYGITQYPIYEKDVAGTFFIQFKDYKPAKNRIGHLYPTVPYENCLVDICTDTEISKFDYSYVTNGFSAGTVVNFFNGEPTPEAKKDIAGKLKKSFTGAENAGSTVINYVDKDGKAVEVTAVNVADLDKKFTVISERTQQKIITGHRVTNPELFGIKTDGQLGARVPLKESQDLFLNSYVKPRQNKKCAFMSKICFLKTGQWIDFETIQLDLVGIDLSSDPDLTQDERREIKGYDPLSAPKINPDGTPIQQEEATGNDVLNKLSRKQVTNLIKTVDDYTKGRTTRPQAMILLKGFGLSDQEAAEFLGDIQTNLSVQNNVRTVLTALESCCQDDEDDEVIFEEHVNFKNSTDALKFELSRQNMFFADALTISVQELEGAILNALKGNPTSSIDSISRSLGIDPNRVQTGISGLLKKKLVDSNADGFDPTDKAYDKETQPLKVSKIYTVYKYALKDDAPNLLPGGSSRDFCKSLLAKSQAGKHWTFDAIDKLSNDMGMNVWDYRGGPYTHPGGKKKDPFCRHVWKAITKVKRTNG